jgi:hypothetical protein
MLRTHTCGQLTGKDAGTSVALCGWVHTRRDHGGLIFIDLRDRYGLTQVVFHPDTSKDAFTLAESLRPEWVIKVTGKVTKRLAGTCTMAKDLLPTLQAIGLTAEHAQLYLAGLQLGSAPASEYAKVTGMNRITAYTMLEDLAHHGRFTVVKKLRAKYYVPVPPEYLATEARKNADALHRALPELRSLRGSEYRKPHVRFFEGWEGVRRVYDDTLRAKGELLNFANSRRF